MNMKWLFPGCMVLVLAACSSAPKKPGETAGGGKSSGTVVQGKGNARPAHCPDGSPYAAAAEDPGTRGNYTAGGLYKPGVRDTTPDYVPNVACIPEPRVEALERSTVGNRSPYEVLGKKYKVMDSTRGYNERGIASYYGAKFHGRLTSNREVYDMYQFTAAHKTLPLPSFARVTNLDNGESIVVRVNDRGPFHDGRVIDLSYAAAVRLGITQRGTGNVEVRALQPGDDNLLAARSARRAPASPVAMSKPQEPSAPAVSTGMDQLVAKVATAPAAVVPAAPTGEAWRYRVADSAKPGSADNFDRWMRDNKVRVATGKPAAPVAAAVVKADVPSRPVATVPPSPARPAAQPSTATTVLGEVLLQVASFASRDNATRAQGQLASAGIVGATVSSIVAGGRTLFRLRVPANDHVTAAELAGRIAGLGFGAPQIVNE